MAKREPYNLKNLIIVYNIVQIALSAYLTAQVSDNSDILLFIILQFISNET